MSTQTASFDDATAAAVAAAELDLDLEFDLAIAFNLQLQEALSASLSLHHHHQPPSASTSAAAAQSPPFNLSELTGEVLKIEQELKDQAVSQSEFIKLKDDLHRRIHDRRVALEISRMTDEAWDDWGDNFERPFGEGCSKGVEDELFRVYFKGLVEKEAAEGVVLGGIGIAVCDSSDELLFELRKPLVGSGTNMASRLYAEAQALIEALGAALGLGLDRIVFYCDCYPLYKFVVGHWSAKQRKISDLVNHFTHLKEKFIYCQPVLVGKNDIKFAFKLAREAMVPLVSNAAETSSSRMSTETCIICTEETNISQIFSVDGCMHRYCFSCMKQLVEVKLLEGLLPTCPHEGCKTELKLDSCIIFLTPRLIEMMSQRIAEASIPVREKVYCPYPKCSALMSKKEVLEYSKNTIVGAERYGARMCITCKGRFCIDCKVPWHNNMTCSNYKKVNPHPLPEEAKLKNLAATNLWRQCVKCKHMIELSAGCFHMTCRCGYEFCYNCGAKWKNKKQTCSCPLWDEDYILEDNEEDEEDEYEDSSEEEDE